MKKTLALFAVLSLTAASLAFGARGDGVVGGPHDLSGSANEGQERVCAFCHTPHHSATVGGEYLPLWSRAEDTKNFNVAYVSSTINAVALQEGTSDKAIGPTRLCMSCHDGTIAADQHYAEAGGATVLNVDTWGSAGVGAGSGITNDHPVGFDYAAVAIGPETGLTPDAATLAAAAADPNADAWIRNPNAAYVDNTLGLKISDRLYVASNGNAYMTCATCHDVHNKKNLYTTAGVEAVNYLVLAPQAGSKLCLSCHIK